MLDAIRRAIDSGIQVAFASGRMQTTIQPYIAIVQRKMPIVACNGAQVIDQLGHVVHHVTLNDAVKNAIIDYALTHNIQINLYASNQTFSTNRTQWGELYLKRVAVAAPTFVEPNFLRSTPATKILLVDDPERIPSHQAAFTKQVEHRAELVISEPEYLEFLPAGVNKGAGLERLASHLRLMPGHVAAIGDYLNDLEMLKWAGKCAAPANAHPKILDAVRAVYPSHDKGGVAQFIDAILHNNHEAVKAKKP